MIKRSNIKESFGGELAFTRFISSDVETSKRLLLALDLNEDDYKITPEEHTQHSKRVDLVVRDRDNDIILVVESQDASGWLDSIHASKITYYMFDKKCDDGVLICEDADEHIKNYVRWLNENTPLRITLVSVVIYKDEKPFCDFIPLIRPTYFEDKKIVTKSNLQDDGDTLLSSKVQDIYNSNPGVFTNVTKNYVNRTNVGGTGINVGIVPYKTGGHFVDVWHAGKANTDEFRNSFSQICSKYSYEAKFQNRRGYINGSKVESVQGAIEAAKIFIEGLESGEIKV